MNSTATAKFKCSYFRLAPLLKRKMFHFKESKRDTSKSFFLFLTQFFKVNYIQQISMMRLMELILVMLLIPMSLMVLYSPGLTYIMRPL